MILYDEVGNAIGEIYEPNTQPKKGKRIALCIGHDYDKRGAYGNKNISEWDFNDTLVKEIVLDDRLSKHNTYHIFYRSADLNGYTAKMNDLHKRIDAELIDISIEFHFNGSNNPSVNGYEALYYSQGGKDVADKLVNAFSSNLPTNNRGSKQLDSSDNGYGFVSKGKSLAVISEPYFSLNQNRFVHGGDLRESLIRSYINFFNSL